MVGWSGHDAVRGRAGAAFARARIPVAGRLRRTAWAVTLAGLALGAAGCGAGTAPGTTSSDAAPPSMAAVGSASVAAEPTVEPTAGPSSEPTAGPATEGHVVDLDAVPADIPLVVDRLLRVVALDAGGWQVDVELADRGGYDRARAALLTAGYDVVSETRPGEMRWTGDFANVQYTVHLDVSNDTGGGFMGDYLIARRS